MMITIFIKSCKDVNEANLYIVLVDITYAFISAAAFRCDTLALIKAYSYYFSLEYKRETKIFLQYVEINAAI